MANSAKLAVVQMSCSSNTTDNIEKALSYVREAATNGANIVLLQELFENIYFPQIEHPEHFALANEIEGHPFLTTFQALAKELGVVLPISFFEKAGQAYYNSLMMYDADGSALGLYRKSHIPDGPSYEEKYYFNPGDTGFKTWRTKFGRVGVGICWDQWFPEAARAMVLQGADLLLYPTAIGSEPADMSLAVQGEDAAGLDAVGLDAVGLDTRDMWQRAMQGHAISNICYVAGANRVGTEEDMTFYGSSFITDIYGAKQVEADRSEETIIYAQLDFAHAQKERAGWGFFRDRRPELYKTLLSADGTS